MLFDMIDVNFINEFFSWQFWAFFGICLEIIGFVLMTFLWGKHPRMKQYLKWREDHEELFSKWRTRMGLLSMNKAIDSKKWYTMLHWSSMYMDDFEQNPGHGYDAVVRYLEVPNRFKFKWILQTKIVSIVPVIVGLVFQGIQLIKI